MTYEEQKKVVEAAVTIKEYCEKNMRENINCDCPFKTIYGCKLFSSNGYKFPKYLEIPTLTRWTPEDVALAKALKDKGVTEICVEDGVYCYDEKRNLVMRIYEILPTFERVKKYKVIDIDTIIKEAEE